MAGFAHDDLEEWLRITEMQLPVHRSAVPQTVAAGWLPSIEGLDERQIKDLLKNRWSSFREPFLQNISEAVLKRELLCLSIDYQGDQWLSFEDDSSALHVAPFCSLQNDLRSRFPFHQIPGLADFVENFGGLANWTLPPCPWFVPSSECRVVAAGCDYYEWGMIGDWEGSLTLYNTCGGNFIVVSPDDRCAIWDHDVSASDNEDPFKSLGWNMSTLIDEFVAYLSLDDNQAKDSPFYY